MSKVTYPIYKASERIVFNANGTYTLLDTGFPKSISLNGKIGPFSVNTKDRGFFDSFINLTIPDGSKVTAILTPMDGYNCHLTQDSVTITDDEEDIPEHEFFLPFIPALVPSFIPEFMLPFDKNKLPIVEGTMNGTPIRFFFDSGARMTMFGEEELAGGKSSMGSYTEWMAMLKKHETLSVYDVALEFPCGLHYDGKGALVEDTEYLMAGRMMGIRAMLGIDFFNEYDLYFSTANARRGIALAKRK